MSVSCEATKILLIEDHPIVQAGVMPYIESVAENATVIVADTLQNAIDIIASDSELSLVIADLSLPDGNGMDVLEHIRQTGSPAPTIVLSATDDIDTMRLALAQGARGFMTKDIDPEQMVHALRLVHAGGTYVPEQMLKSLLMSPGQGQNENSLRGLTNRQIQVLKLLIDGYSNKQIASRIDCAESTVKAHVTAVLKTLGVANRSKAAEAAKKWNWPELSSHHLNASSQDANGFSES